MASSIDRRTLLGSAAMTPFASVLGACASDGGGGAPAGSEGRAAALVAQMTVDEKILLVQSHFFLPPEALALMPNKAQLAPPSDALRTSGYIQGIPRLGLAPINEGDAGLGVAQGVGAPPGGRRGTAFPATVLTAATWDPSIARRSGVVIGQEARANGISVMLAGGCNLTRDPRCGRTFEYFGEDPLLSGEMAGAAIDGIQSQKVMSTVKHFALNAQETGRSYIDEQIDEAALRESDLLGFQIAIERGAPGAVMTAYNMINGAHCSENHWLLSKVLKGDWNYPGFVMSDWGSVRSTHAPLEAGLDQQSGQEVDPAPFYGEPLKQLALADKAAATRLDEMVTRILRSLIDSGVIDHPPHPGGPIDEEANAGVAQRTAEEGIVLLKNANGLLPLSERIRKIALIGDKADVGVLSGGGSSQTTPPNSILTPEPDSPIPMPRVEHPSSPLRAIKAQAANVEVRFNDGADHAVAAALARESDVAIVIARRWDTEGRDAADLTLPHDQDALIRALAAANPRTIVVVTAGGPVAMPWRDSVDAVLMAWYPGIRGAEALAAILFGAVNPSGRLPVTFPQRVADLPRPEIVGIDLNVGPTPGIGNPPPPNFVAHMNEGADVGYRWHERQGHSVLFPFGFGLSYTDFSIRGLEIGPGAASVSCMVTNIGAREGKQVVQIYGRPPQAGATRRLIGFTKINLMPLESKRVTISVEPRLLARFDIAANNWRIEAGAYDLWASASSADVTQHATITLQERRIRV